MSASEWFGRQGGAAFPVPKDGGYDAEIGMSLRDWFAGQALTGMIAGSAGLEIGTQQFAEQSYRLADAMIAARAGA